MRYRFIPVYLLLIVIVMLTGAASAQDAETGLPRFEPGACLFSPPQNREVECGFFVVPENHSSASSPEIRLAVAIFRSNNPEKAPDPLIYLEGGPGGSALKTIAPVFDTFLGPFARTRDVIVLDQRGVGFSQPALDCPEYADYYAAVIEGNPTVEEEVSGATAALDTCRARLAATGADLSAYNSAANAADVAALAAALGYEHVNLLGVSYGSRLALTILRDYPALVRSAVLAAVYPLQVSLAADTAPNINRALTTLFAGCAADETCSAAYPDLESDFYGLIERLNAEPARLTIINPITAQPFEALVSGDEFVSAIFRTLYATDLLPLMPQGIAAIRDGEYGTLASYLQLNLAVEAIVSRGMYLSVQCNEDVAFDTAEALEASYASFPQLASFFQRGGDFVALCAAWDSGTAADIENEPVSSDVPILLISGEYDPITPPAWGDLAAETLSASTHAVIPAASHDAIFTECPQSIALAFLDEPSAAPDTSCADEIAGVAFALPGGMVELPEFAFVPYSDASGSFSAVVPDGWTEAQAGVYARVNTPLDQTALLLVSVPADLNTFLAAAAQQLGLDAPPEAVDTREANGLTWSVYEVEFFGLPTVLAAAEQNGVTYTIQIVTNSPAERAALRDALLLPVVDAFTLNQ